MKRRPFFFGLMAGFVVCVLPVVFVVLTRESGGQREYEADVVERECGLPNGMLDPSPVQVMDAGRGITAYKFVPEGAERPVLTYYDNPNAEPGFTVGCDGTRFGDGVYDADRGVVVLPDGRTQP